MEADFASASGGLYYKKFGEKFGGFTKENEKFWPKLVAGEEFLKRMQLMVPGSIEMENSKGEIVKRDTYQKFFKRLENLRTEKRLAWTKTKGML